MSRDVFSMWWMTTCINCFMRLTYLYILNQQPTMLASVFTNGLYEWVISWQIQVRGTLAYHLRAMVLHNLLEMFSIFFKEANLWFLDLLSFSTWSQRLISLWDLLTSLGCSEIRRCEIPASWGVSRRLQRAGGKDRIWIGWYLSASRTGTPLYTVIDGIWGQFHVAQKSWHTIPSFVQQAGCRSSTGNRLGRLFPCNQVYHRIYRVYQSALGLLPHSGSKDWKWYSWWWLGQALIQLCLPELVIHQLCQNQVYNKQFRWFEFLMVQ